MKRGVSYNVLLCFKSSSPQSVISVSCNSSLSLLSWFEPWQKPRKRKEKWKRIWNCPTKIQQEHSSLGYWTMREWSYGDWALGDKTLKTRHQVFGKVKFIYFYPCNSLPWVQIIFEICFDDIFFLFQNHLRIFNGHFFFKETIIVEIYNYR